VGRWLPLTFAVPAVAFAAVVYFPITRCYFYVDDFINLFHIVNDDLWQYLVRENGGHILLTRNTLFYLTFALAGPTPEVFFWCALITHLINVLLLFVVVLRLTGRPGLASFGAAFWGISPLNAGALDWYSVYGHVVVATATLIVLAQASGCVATGRPPSPRMRRGWYVLALMAATSFGTGVGIAMALPFILWLLLTPIVRRPPLASLVVVVPALYVALMRLFEYSSHTQAPVRMIVRTVFSTLPAMWTMFTRVSGFGIAEWATGFVLPTPTPPHGWTMSLLIATVVALITAVIAPPRVRRQLAAAALVTIAAYGTIALGRGALMETAADELVQGLTRYHYVAPIGLTITLCLVLAQLGRFVDRRLGLAALAAWYVIAVISFNRSSFVIDEHQLERRQTEAVLASIRAAIDAQPPGTTVRLENASFPPFPLQTFVPGWAAAFTMFYPDNVVDGRRVEFVEDAAYIVDAYKHGHRIGRVLVSP
jgi:hypothetical protein